MVVSSVSLVPTVQVVHHTQLNEALLGVKNRPAARWHNHIYIYFLLFPLTWLQYLAENPNTHYTQMDS